MKTSELSGVTLDWAVAKCENLKVHPATSYVFTHTDAEGFQYAYEPSTDWAQGGPIIEREQIECTPPTPGDVDREWMSVAWSTPENCVLETGPTPLIAAMRCYVASKLGDNVGIPEELA